MKTHTKLISILKRGCDNQLMALQLVIYMEALERSRVASNDDNKERIQFDDICVHPTFPSAR